MDYLPVFLDSTGQTGLVVGGGQVAARKVELLRRAGLAVSVVAPRLCPALAEAAERGEIAHRAEVFRADMVAGAGLVIAATDRRLVNAEAAAVAKERGIPVNVVDCPELSTFIVPAIVDRSPLVIALSTAGRAPVLARLLRARLEAFIPAAYGRLAALVGRFREAVKARFADGVQRRRFWEHVLEGPIGEQALQGDAEGAEQALAEALAEGASAPTAGEVALVGAGPGDPDLLTLKALRVMQRADVVVHDRLVSGALLDRARRDAERIAVSKGGDGPSASQEAINDLLVERARRGERVVRLKGGDPFVFGRGAEEAARLREAGVAYQVVPGITAAVGCAASSGIPLTHRDHADAVVLVTGHLQDGILRVPWETLTQPHQTAAVYMGLKGLPQLVDGLLDRGLPPETPAALVERGATPEQRVIETTLARLPAEADAAGLRPPVLVLIGPVAALREPPGGAGESAG